MDVRQKSKADLLRQLKDLKAELKLLATGGAPDRRLKIDLVRVSISHLYTDLAKAKEEEAFASRFTHQASLKNLVREEA